MKCEEIRSHLSEYADGETAPEISRIIEAHLEDCEDCRQRLTQLEAVSGAIAGLGEEELPLGFSTDFADKLNFEKKNHPKTKPLSKRSWFRVTAVVAACLVIFIGVGSVFFGGYFRMDANSSAPQDAAYDSEIMTSESMYGAQSSNDSLMRAGDMQEGADEDSGTGIIYKDEATGAEPNVASTVLERKIIKNAYLDLEVGDFEIAFATIENLASQYGGYVVTGEKYNSEDDPVQRGYISLRVDATQLDQAISEIEALGKVDSSRESTDDITSDYYDLQGRLAQYEAQRDRLLDFYDSAGTIDELISLESELTRVEVEIESLTGTLERYDQLTDLSLINVNIYTPSAYTTSVEPKGFKNFWNNVQSAFLNGINGFLSFIANVLVFIVRILPWLVILAAIITVIIVVRHQRRKKRQI